MNELIPVLPCVCGNRPVFEYAPDLIIRIECSGCGKGLYGSRDKVSERELIARWNESDANRVVNKREQSVTSGT